MKGEGANGVKEGILSTRYRLVLAATYIFVTGHKGEGRGVKGEGGKRVTVTYHRLILTIITDILDGFARYDNVLEPVRTHFKLISGFQVVAHPALMTKLRRV